ncbi:PREDICTED: mitogen-activated protein kinase kinase kinase YODA-like [Ipomoea nil]|uniref:mitogen-activated protein kinase kinase kinase YODA-like n=1 Tax=Ipomoea nil TaxID=35883 RepID=UPI000900F9A4|nr:PREDICTED: mitogen-activated protein kinase kinase kinase YODA-like [Ipomoea nil]
MPSWLKAFTHNSFSSHSSRANLSAASSSRSASESPVAHGGSASDRHVFAGGAGRRLIRQRKLRHATDDELGLKFGDFDGQSKSKSLPVSPDSGSRFPRNAGHWSKSALPQPLPLPKQYGESLPAKGEGEAPTSAFKSNPSCDSVRKAVNPTRRASTPTYRRRGFHQDPNAKDGQDGFRLNVPPRSAPTSGFNSPVLSPKRFSTVDLFNPAFQLSSPPLDRVAGHPTQLSPTRSMDHSPPSNSARNHTGVAAHSHHKSLPESPVAWPDSNNINVHPLPLPPGVSRQSQSCPVRQNLERSDTPPLKGLWQKGKCIGRGTYGTVYVATNRETGALCAMKEVLVAPDDSKAIECVKQLEQEIEVLRQLKHPNIVQYYGSEIFDDRFCIYLEYVHPGSLNKYLKEYGGAMTESIVRNFTRHIVSGLAYLHSTKTIHRDIKGANLLVDASGIVKLADFGLAKHLCEHTMDLSLKGSPYWMAPEVLQAVLRKDANPELALAVDIWSLGCTVIEMFTGQPPWSELNGVQAMFSVLHKSPPIPETLSSEGKNFLQCCFQRKPADRPSALKLLDHPFLRNSHYQHVAGSSADFSGIKHDNTPQSPQDLIKQQPDLTTSSPRTPVRHIKLSRSSESGLLPNHETSDVSAAPRHSPHSTLEVFPCIFSPEFN